MRLTPTLLLLALLGAVTSGLGAASASRPNVLVIYTDDQGYGDMGALNPQSKIPTPHLDRLAREGLLFTDGHCADTVCTPSRYALLTGRYAWRTHLKRAVLHAEGDCLIAPGRMTVASLLRDHGYRTAMFGKWHLNMRFPGSVGQRDWSQPILDGPMAHGFDEFFGIPASMNYGVLTFIANDRVTDPPSRWTRRKPTAEAGNFRFMPPYDAERQGPEDIEIAPSFRDEICLRVCTEQAVAFLERHAATRPGQPFFLYLALNSPHLPHCADPEFTGRSRVGAYGDFMLETDHRVGQVLAALDRLGLARDTLVLQSSDNGPENGYAERERTYGHASNGGLRGGKRDIYEGGHRVPFVVRWPAVVRAGRTCAEPVGQVDLLATCADLLGVKLPADAGEDSFSLLPALRGDEYPRPLRGALIHHSGSGFFAIREGAWKLNLFRGSGGSLAPRWIAPRPGEPAFELYDLVRDLRETTNVAAQHPDVTARLSALATRLVREGRSTPGPARANDGPALWPELTWIPGAPALDAPAGKKRGKGTVD